MLSVGVAAEQGSKVTLVPAPTQGVKFSAPWLPADVATGDTLVIGTVIDIREAPVQNAAVQLRDLKTGNVVAKTTTNEQGAYTYPAVEPGTYVVEMVMVDGSVAGLSNAGAIARYETLQTVIRLPGLWDAMNRTVIGVNNPASFLGMSSAVTMTAATLVIASENAIPSTDPGEPVSP